MFGAQVGSAAQGLRLAAVQAGSLAAKCMSGGASDGLRLSEVESCFQKLPTISLALWSATSPQTELAQLASAALS